jgi:hypothetical protein
VRYSSTNVESEFLKYDCRKEKHLLVISGKDKKVLKGYARRAEEANAEMIRELRDQRRLPRSTSLGFRPLQPVFLVGSVEATIIEQPDKNGWVKIRYANLGRRPKEETESILNIRLIGHKPEPISLEQFFREHNDLPKQKTSYRESPNFLRKAWKEANGSELAMQFEESFEKLVEVRDKIRMLAGGHDNGKTLTAEAAQRLVNRVATLLSRLKDDFDQPSHETMMVSSDFKQRIVDINNILPHANILLLCGGIAPEVTVHKRFDAAPLGTVILQDIDLHAVGVAVAAHTDVNFALIGDPKSQFAPGDIRILRDQAIIRQVEVQLGGIHSVGITNPCQSFSLAGNKEGFISSDGQLLWDCLTIVRGLEESSQMPLYLAENVPSTKETNDQFNAYLPHRNAACFYACGSMCSPCKRKRKFATNRPPVICSEGPRRPGEPPSLNGDLPEVCAPAVVKEEGRLVHPRLKKLPCFTHSGPTKNNHVWVPMGLCEKPVQKLMTPTEAERAMGYYEDEIGVTAYSAEKAILERIKNHNYERDGCIISLKGCAGKESLEKVDDKRRLELLGNSQVVTLLEALMWNDRRLFPAVQRTAETEG